MMDQYLRVQGNQRMLDDAGIDPAIVLGSQRHIFLDPSPKSDRDYIQLWDCSSVDIFSGLSSLKASGREQHRHLAGGWICLECSRVGVFLLSIATKSC